MKNLPDIDRMPLGRSILKNCRANASCVNCYVTLSINLPSFHGHSQVRDSAQSPHPAQAVHTPTAYCTAASPVLPVCKSINPLSDAALYRSTSIHHTPDSYTKTRTTLFLLCTKSCIVWRKIGVWRSFCWKFTKRKSLKLLGTSRSFRLCCLEIRNYWSMGFIVGNSSTSRMEAESVRSMTKRSTPKPRPPVGGRPYSRAVT